ncbi:spermidine/putrescine ABC transporter substrate-binding protein [Leptolyngbya sp. GB1-A1]|uniref:ABC transporter substrate-binding protein n=1 Tax=Leptolyngbya sp. GB1-A1 TaxID=2933908 RepID=UPI003297CA29
MTSDKPRSIVGRSTRRRFLQFSATALSTIALSNCARSIQGGGTASDSDAAPAASGGSGDAKTLYIYTWGDYSNPDFFKRFTDKTGIEVVVDVYDSNETMLAKIQAGGGAQYSIIYPSDYMVRQMIEMNLLTKLDPSKIQGVNGLMDRWQSPPYDPGNAHSIPYCWGTTGILYNSEIVKTPPQDWNFFWDNKEALAGKITLLDDVRETMGATLKSLGYSYNATNPKQIEAAYQKLLELKPSIAAFRTFGWEDQLISGDLAACMTYSTFGNLLPKDNPQLAYVIPDSGTSVWTDTVAIPASAPNLDAAYAWINYVLEPENAIYGVEQMNVITPNKIAFDKLPTQIKSDAKRYPTQQLLSISDGIAPVGKALDLYDKYWNDLKSA